MLDPSRMVNVDRGKIEEMKPSPVSMMPEGLLDTLNRDEVLDLSPISSPAATARTRCSARVGVGLRSIAPNAEEGPEEFFDGENFEGSGRAHGILERAGRGHRRIKVVDPRDLKFNSFLCSKKTYKDFELTVPRSECRNGSAATVTGRPSGSAEKRSSD